MYMTDKETVVFKELLEAFLKYPPMALKANQIISKCDIPDFKQAYNEVLLQRKEEKINALRLQKKGN